MSHRCKNRSETRLWLRKEIREVLWIWRSMAKYVLGKRASRVNTPLLANSLSACSSRCNEFLDAEKMHAGGPLIVTVLDDRQRGFEREIREEGQFEVFIQWFTLILEMVICQVMRRGMRDEVLTQICWRLLWRCL